jgi:hypothetical protein
MDARILKIRPDSGAYREVRVNAAEGNTIFVKFEDANYDEYIGVLGGGIGTCSAVAIVDQLAFIISLGQGYIFDIAKRKIVHQTTCDYLNGVVPVENQGVFVACDLTDLYVFDISLLWTSDRVSLDGVEFEDVRGSTVHGYVYSESDCVPFSLNVENYVYQCDWVCDL